MKLSEIVARVNGMSTPIFGAKLTLDTYGHLMGTDADRAALERVNRALGHPAGTQAGSSTALDLLSDS